jgi:hypothetical protein
VWVRTHRDGIAEGHQAAHNLLTSRITCDSKIDLECGEYDQVRMLPFEPRVRRLGQNQELLETRRLRACEHVDFDGVAQISWMKLGNHSLAVIAVGSNYLGIIEVLVGPLARSGHQIRLAPVAGQLTSIEGSCVERQKDFMFWANALFAGGNLFSYVFVEWFPGKGLRPGYSPVQIDRHNFGLRTQRFPHRAGTFGRVVEVDRRHSHEKRALCCYRS